jgi:hypothetical protein
MIVDAVALIVTAIAAVLSAFYAWRATKKVETVHLMINSRMDDWIAAAEKVAHAAGVVEGAQQQQQPDA